MLPAIRETRRQRLHAEAVALVAASKSSGTLDVYEHAWKDFEQFCTDNNTNSLPAAPATIVAYLTHLSRGQKPSTIQVKLSAIEHYHVAARMEPPTNGPEIKALMAGIRRKLGTRPDKKSPITLDDLRAMTAGLPDTLAGRRDRAIILVGWAGAFRRSELVALDVADVEIGRRLTIHVNRSKTDQTGEGMVKVIPAVSDKAVCALAALKAWLHAAEITDGPLFRSVTRWDTPRTHRLPAKTVALIVQSAAQSIGLEADDFGGHSLRSGFITEAASGGAESRDIMSQSGHTSERVMRGYIQDEGRGAIAAVKAAYKEKDGKR